MESMTTRQLTNASALLTTPPRSRLLRVMLNPRMQSLAATLPFVALGLLLAGLGPFWSGATGSVKTLSDAIKLAAILALLGAGEFGMPTPFVAWRPVADLPTPRRGH